MIKLDPPSAREIIRILAKTIAREHGITVEQLLSHDRSRRYSWPRQELYAKAKLQTGLGRVALGNILGRDRATIYHGIRAYRQRDEVRQEWVQDMASATE